MLKRSGTIWVYPCSQIMISRGTFAQFAFRNLSKRRIIVFPQSAIPKECEGLIERYKRLRLIEVRHIDEACDILSEVDFRVAKKTREIAEHLVSFYASSMLSKSG